MWSDDGWMVSALACQHGGKEFNSLLWHIVHASRPTNDPHTLGGLQMVYMPKGNKLVYMPKGVTSLGIVIYWYIILIHNYLIFTLYELTSLNTFASFQSK